MDIEPWPAAPLEHDLALEVLTRVFRADHSPQRVPTDPELSSASLNLILGASARPALTYTAFDGDLFELTPQMRAWVMHRGWVPANPESIVGYKDSVEAHQSKADVLLDDMAIVSKCDSLCVFTDVAPDPHSAMEGLAEGVIVELLYFLGHNRRDQPNAEIMFVPIGSLYDAHVKASPFSYSYEETISYLGIDQQGIDALLKSIEAGTRSLPKVAYIAHDPLDAKYSNWLRPFAYGEGRVPLVPSLSLRLADIPPTVGPGRSAGTLLAGRLRMLDLADELWVFPSQDISRDEAYTTTLVKACWESHRGSSWTSRSWRELKIPKEVDADWPLTEREVSILKDAENALAPLGVS